MDDSGFPRCDCCGTDGSDGRVVTVVCTSREMRATCSFCQGLLDAGMIREEWVGDVRRFRRWSAEWKPGELVPRPGRVTA